MLLILLPSCQELYCELDGGEVKKVRVWESRRPITHELVPYERRVCYYSDSWFKSWYLRD